MANYTVVWDEAVPPGTESKSLGDDRIKEKQVAIRERLATEHTSAAASAGDALLMHEWVVTAIGAAGSPYTVLPSQHVILVTTGASDYTLNLPTAIGIVGKPYKIKKVDSGVGTVIIDPYSTQTVDGASTFVLTDQYDFVDIVSDNANWQVLSTNSATGAYSLKFPAAPVNKINWAIGDIVPGWNEVDISANTGTDKAKAALLAVVIIINEASASTQSSYCAFFRPKGSSEANLLSRLRATCKSGATDSDAGASYGNIIVQCSSAEIFEFFLDVTEGSAEAVTFKIDLIGYFV